MHELTLYMKPSCHLCHDAADLLARLGPEMGFSFTEMDITQDGALYDQYRDSIPVVALEGRVLLEAPIKETNARKVLKAALR